jgi:hypothetical protein
MDRRRPLPTDWRRLTFGMYPFLPKLFADGGYQGQAFRKALAKALPQFEIDIFKRPDHAKGFEVSPTALVCRTHFRLLRARYSINLCLQTLFDGVSGSLRSTEFAPHLAVAECGNAGNRMRRRRRADGVRCRCRCRCPRKPAVPDRAASLSPLLAEPMMVASTSGPLRTI